MVPFDTSHLTPHPHAFSYVNNKSDAETFDSSVRSNVTGPLLLTQALHPLMEPAKGKKVFNMASGLGSIAKGAHTMNPLCETFSTIPNHRKKSRLQKKRTKTISVSADQI